MGYLVFAPEQPLSMAQRGDDTPPSSDDLKAMAQAKNVAELCVLVRQGFFSERPGVNAPKRT